MIFLIVVVGNRGALNVHFDKNSLLARYINATAPGKKLLSEQPKCAEMYGNLGEKTVRGRDVSGKWALMPSNLLMDCCMYVYTLNYLSSHILSVWSKHRESLPYDSKAKLRSGPEEKGDEKLFV